MKGAARNITVFSVVAVVVVFSMWSGSGCKRAVNEQKAAVPAAANVPGAGSTVENDVAKLVKLCEQYSQKGDFQNAEKICGQLVVLAPNDVWAIRTVGGVYAKENKDNEAETYFRKAAESGTNKMESGFAYFGLYQVYAKKGDPKRAAECLEKAYQLNPQDTYIAQEYKKLKS
jgi:tetratricopeptide (TPR) repeat protein